MISEEEEARVTRRNKSTAGISALNPLLGPLADFSKTTILYSPIYLDITTTSFFQPG